MVKKIGLLVFTIGILAAVVVFYMNEKGETKLEGTQVMDLVSSVNIGSSSDFSFETVHQKKIEIDVEDRYFKIKGMENKTVFLKVFGWDCKFCKKEIPELVKLKSKLGDSFEVVAIEAQHFSNEESLKYIQEYGVNYHIVPGEFYTDFYAYLQEKYGWTGVIPLTIVLGKSGEVLAFEIGSKSYSLSELMKASLLRK
jgi:thiol-disulfide isomerase/thioredoxin